MKLKSLFLKDPDFFDGSFEPILVEATLETSKSTIVLGFIEEHGVLHFVIRKRYPTWIVDIRMDRIRLSEAVRNIRDKGLLPDYNSYEETLRIAFEDFVRGSPFGEYIRENVNAWATSQFFKQLRAVAPTLIVPQTRLHNGQGSGDCTLQSVGRESG